MATKAEDIKVKVNYPEESSLQEEIGSIMAKWILNQQIELYGEENLKQVYPLWIKSKEATLNNIKLKNNKVGEIKQ
ncbi:MAG: hypothetical protein ACRC3Y_13580 [Romboutsia sp.]|uniref:hypothetical protein n=1 Tax=Romboutsia sp. TaxID=1965302 RepID=UPI003F2BD887